MNVDYFRDVDKFQTKFKLDALYPKGFSFLNPELFKFRAGFLTEEYNEYKEAYKRFDLADAIDSLIDLVYVTCGAALLHGIKESEWWNLIYSEEAKAPIKFDSDAYVGTFASQIPSFQTYKIHATLCLELEKCIAEYIDAHEKNHEFRLKQALAKLHNRCLQGGELMGFSPRRWNVLWKAVQTANMAKERAEKPSDSKRGTQYDVIKPEGWQAPRIEELIAGMGI